MKLSTDKWLHFAISAGLLIALSMCVMVKEDGETSETN
jgi:hypothetical protein